MKFSDLSLQKKIFILLMLPIGGILFLSLFSIKSNYTTYQSMVEVEQSVNLVTNFSNLVHELQKERGATAGFIGSNGKKFGQAVIAQRKLTDEKLALRAKFLRESTLTLPTFKQLNQRIEQSLNELATIRSQVDSQSIDASLAIGFYTKLNAKLLSVASLIAKQSDNGEINQHAIAFYNFLQGKERAGVERAVLSNTFAVDKFTNATLVKFITLKSEQETYFGYFNTLAKAQNKQFLQQQLQHPAVVEVARMKKLALGQPPTFNIDPEYWFNQATLRIGQLKKVENHLGLALVSLASATKKNALNILIINSLLSVSLILITLLISFMVIRDILARVNDLSQVLSKVEQDNDLTVSARLLGNSELGSISNALNSTLGKFSIAVDEISTTSATLAAGAEQTSQTCVRNSKSMNEQQDEITLVATAIEEISVTVKEVATNTQLALDSAQLADVKSKEGLEIVQESYHSIESLELEINGLAGTINSLHESSSNITSVVDVIKSVADQTNLLALNAAIEAARAGEQGRGFAVVADEVRTLAKRTQESTTEIENFINALQNDVNNAFSVIETSQRKAQAAVGKSKNVEHMLADITDSVGTIFSMTEQISVAAEEQAVVTQEIARNIVNVEHKSQGATENADEIATTAIEQAQLAQRLQSLSSQFIV